MRITILHQDDDIVVVDKPAGLPTHAAEAHDPYAGDALRIVQGQLGLAYLGMHQRLDADTSLHASDDAHGASSRIPSTAATPRTSSTPDRPR
mgnify:CR=1 FL=1